MKSIKFLSLIVLVSLISVLTACTTDESTIMGNISYEDFDDGQEYIANNVKVYLMPIGETDIDNAEDVVNTNDNGDYIFTLVPDGYFFIYSEFTDIVQLHTYKGNTTTVKVKGRDTSILDFILN